MENYVRKLLPANPTYVVNVDVTDVEASDSNFSATLRVNIRSKEEFRIWLQEHEKLSSCTYRVLKTKPSDRRYVLYKVCSTLVLLFVKE